jgi:putative SOS response-associated peptidase YedK
MCGRFALTSAPATVRQTFGYDEQPNFPPRYNIAPTQPIAIVTGGRDAQGEFRRRFQLVRWGFLPGFVKDTQNFPLLINARAETAAEKASFRNALRRRRCLIPADAYYEWLRFKVDGKTARRAFLFRRADGEPMGLAGLWEPYLSPDGSEIDTACILTTAANGATVAVHERMPVIIERKEFARWLDCDDSDVHDAEKLMRQTSEDTLTFFEIGPAINKATAIGPELQAPLQRPSA